MTIPNTITILRILLTPVFIVCLINDRLLVGLVILIVCGASDGLDGFAARVLDQKSRLGSFLDPLADKLILVSAFITLGIRGFLPSWLAVAAISRDILILIGVTILYINDIQLNIKPAISSKITTCLQFAAVIAVLAREYLTNFADYYFYLYHATAIFTIISFFQYLHQWLKMMVEKPERP